MKKYIAVLLLSMIMGLLAACHGGDDTATVASVTAAACTEDSEQFGNGTGASFVSGTLSVGLSSLSAGGTTSVTANIVDCNGSPYTTPVEVDFSSNCTGSNTAQLDTAVISNNGTATSTYIAQGCQGNDIITATTILRPSTPSPTLVATGVVNVLPAAVGSIEFVSATPELIALKGTGGVGLTETSTVVFRVSDISSGPVANQDVTFSLSTTVGGLSLSSSTGTTNSNGLVQTVVQAGTVPTSVRVTATVTGSSPTIASQSDQLVVSTGLPDQDSFTIALTDFNPEVYEYAECEPDLKDTDIYATVFLSDHFNNPVPDGTAVTFSAEGGQIQPSCTTVNGICQVRWCSAEPRPADGRVTILATALGVESFDDNNGNGMFDDGENTTDLDEAYRDDNENGVFDIGTDELADFNVNGIFDAADGEFNGVLCNPSNTATPCSVNKTLNVRASTVLVMASSNLNISVLPAGAIDLSGGAVTLTVSVDDNRGQVPPAETTIAINTDNGDVIGPNQYTVPSTTNAGPYVVQFVLAPDSTPSNDGIYTVTVTTPKSVIWTTFDYVNEL